MACEEGGRRGGAVRPDYVRCHTPPAALQSEAGVLEQVGSATRVGHREGLGLHRPQVRPALAPQPDGRHSCRVEQLVVARPLGRNLVVHATRGPALLLARSLALLAVLHGLLDADQPAAQLVLLRLLEQLAAHLGQPNRLLEQLGRRRRGATAGHGRLPVARTARRVGRRADGRHELPGLGLT
eukprot:scaffold2645_cov112-Isochrysis_galbana.AAC.6